MQTILYMLDCQEARRILKLNSGLVSNPPLILSGFIFRMTLCDRGKQHNDMLPSGNIRLKPLMADCSKTSNTLVGFALRKISVNAVSIWWYVFSILLGSKKIDERWINISYIGMNSVQLKEHWRNLITSAEWKYFASRSTEVEKVSV